MQFVELSKGSFTITLDKDQPPEKYYKHQVCMYLTLNDKGQLKVNTIFMPSYSDIQ